MENFKRIVMNEMGELNFLGKLAISLLLLLITVLVKNEIKKLIKKGFDTKIANSMIDTGRTKTLVTLMQSVVSVVMYLIWIFIALDIFKIDAKGLVATAGIGGIAIGFAAKSFLEDLISGMFLLMEDTFNAGDYVKLADKEGIVQKVGLRTTIIKDFNGDLHTIPNSQIKIVTNKSKNEQRALVEVPISYESDIRKAKDVLVGGLSKRFEGDKAIVRGPDLIAPISLSDSGVIIRVIAYTVPGEQWRVETAMREEVKNLLDANQIEIPYNKLDVNIKK